MLSYTNISMGSNIAEQSTDYRSSAKEMSECVDDGQVGGHGHHMGQHMWKDSKWKSTLDIKGIITVVITV